MKTSLIALFVFLMTSISWTPADNGALAAQGQHGQQGIQGPPRINPDPACFDDVNRYVDCGNGTVTDTVTGLIWLKDATCLGSAPWAAANDLASSLAHGRCGLTDQSVAGDWRLPTIEEWVATVARALSKDINPADPDGRGCVTAAWAPSLTNDPGTACLSVGPTSFILGQVDNNFWSSTADETYPWFAHNAYLGDGNLGYASYKAASLQVWPVRGVGTRKPPPPPR